MSNEPVRVLTEKMRKSCQNYILKGMNQIDSMVDAGYTRAYARAQSQRVFSAAVSKLYMEKLRDKQEEREMDLWQEIIADAPKIYRKLKALADETEINPDIKRKIWADILDRAGFQSSNKLDITKRELNSDDVDGDIRRIRSELERDGIDVAKLLGLDE